MPGQMPREKTRNRTRSTFWDSHTSVIKHGKEASRSEGRPEGKKFNAKLKEMNDWLKAVRNLFEIKEWCEVLVAKIRAHYEYYDISGNYASLMAFYKQTCKLVYKWVNRRSQKKSMNWKQFIEYLKRFPLPRPEIKHNIYILSRNV